MTDLALRQSTELTINPEAISWTGKQVAALQQLGVAGASQADLAVFFHQCVKTGLDPFARQIYMIERQGKQTIQTGIDGFRLIARRAVDRARQSLSVEDTQWCGRDGQWSDVWLSADAPAAAKQVLYRNGDRYSAVALLTEYIGLKRDGKPNAMWNGKPALMLAKCAEALALRKAFPQDLSGIFIDEEISQDYAAEAQPVERSSVSRLRAAIKHEDPVEAEVVPEPDTAEPDETVLAELNAEGMDTP